MSAYCIKIVAQRTSQNQRGWSKEDIRAEYWSSAPRAADFNQAFTVFA
jgi:hypothetical protein